MSRLNAFSVQIGLMNYRVELEVVVLHMSQSKMTKAGNQLSVESSMNLL